MGFTWGQQDLGVEVGCGVPGSGKWHGEMKLAYPQLWRKTWWPGGAPEGRGQLWGRQQWGACLVPGPHSGQWPGGKPGANCVATCHCCPPTCGHMALAR